MDLEPASTFARDEAYELRAGFGYARDATPTTAATESVVNALSGGQGGLLFNAGMATSL